MKFVTSPTIAGDDEKPSEVAKATGMTSSMRRTNTLNTYVDLFTTNPLTLFYAFIQEIWFINVVLLKKKEKRALIKKENL